jgi:hypothetical protein
MVQKDGNHKNSKNYEGLSFHYFYILIKKYLHYFRDFIQSLPPRTDTGSTYF